jgi:ABC-2 type transport system permease protein
MWYLIKKETLVLTKNWATYFLTLIVPVISVLTNFIIMQTLNTKLNIIVIEDRPHMIQVLTEGIPAQKGLTVSVVAGDAIDKAKEELRGKKASVVVAVDDQNKVTVYYDESRTDSLIGFQVVNACIQKTTADDLQANYPDLMASVEDKQLFILGEPQNIGSISAKANALNTMISYGITWIFVFTPLNHALGQIQQERTAGSLFYAYKMPVRKPIILLSKLTAIILQCALSLIFFIALASLTGVLNIKLQFAMLLPVLLLITLGMSALGYFLGFILKNPGSSTIITFLLTIPTMLLSMFNTATALDPVLKGMPTYYATQLIRGMIIDGTAPLQYIVVTAIFAVGFFTASCLILKKRDPIKLCKYM